MLILALILAAGYPIMSVLLGVGIGRWLKYNRQREEAWEAERRELVTRVQRPQFVPPPQQKAHSPDQEKQRRIDAAMRNVGKVVPMSGAE
jgi:ribosome maturation protein Sdo1